MKRVLIGLLLFAASPDAKPAIGKIPDEVMIAGGTFAPGSPWSICITPPPNQVLYSSDAWPGRIYKLTLDGKVLGCSASPASSSSSSAGSTPWRARRRTRSMSRSC